MPKCVFGHPARISLPQHRKLHTTYLIVPVGEGIGEEKACSESGMFIFSGGKTFVRGGLGTRFGALSFTSEVKRIFTFVEGKRRMHLKSTERREFLSNAQ